MNDENGCEVLVLIVSGNMETRDLDDVGKEALRKKRFICNGLNVLKSKIFP